TELCLGLPGAAEPKVTGKRGFFQTVDLKLKLQSDQSDLEEENLTTPSSDKPHLPPKHLSKPPSKAQVVGWPPVRSFRKNVICNRKSSSVEESTGSYVKVSMDGAPYLRKVDLKTYGSYQQLSDALAKMFSSFTMNEGNYGVEGMIDFMNESKVMHLLNSSEYVPTYEDKDGDWMLVGDVPWEMFVCSCKRLRIMKGSEAIGLAPRAMEKCKSRN
ncbi:hypothetical protein M569_10024, partial [Genlisea aurea]